MLLGYHFAYRAVPDGGLQFGTGANNSLSDRSGWLYICGDSDRAVGRSLYYIRGQKRACPENEAIFFLADYCISWAKARYSALFQLVQERRLFECTHEVSPHRQKVASNS